MLAARGLADMKALTAVDFASLLDINFVPWLKTHGVKKAAVRTLLCLFLGQYLRRVIRLC